MKGGMKIKGPSCEVKIKGPKIKAPSCEIKIKGPGWCCGGGGDVDASIEIEADAGAKGHSTMHDANGTCTHGRM